MAQLLKTFFLKKIGNKNINVEMCKVLCIIYYSMKLNKLEKDSYFQDYKRKFDIIQTRYINKILEEMSIPHSVGVGVTINNSDFFNMANSISFDRLEALEKFIAELLMQLSKDILTNKDITSDSNPQNNSNSLFLEKYSS